MRAESEREQAVASAEKPEVSTEACTFSLDINIEALNPQGPRKVLESRNLKWPQWENQNFLILYNRPDKFSETLRSKSFVNINKQRLTFREDKDQYPEPIDVYLGEEEADLGFLYAMGDEYIHTRLRSPSPKRNSGYILRNVDRKITPELCSTCRSVNNRISARNEFTKRSQSPSKWLHSISMCCQHEKDTKPSILTYPVIRQYHEEKERMLMKNPKIEKYNSPERNWNRTESTKLPNKNMKRAEKFRSRLTNCNSQSEASFLLHKEKELQKSEWGLGDNIRHHPGRSRDVQPSQCAQLEKTRKPSILNLTIEIPSPPEVPVSQTSCVRDADTVVHIHGTGSMGRLSIALETDDIDSLKMRTCVSDDKIIANYYNR
ncbi:hypothetical protein C0J52_21390 [Blattella germanica]|nr:hypothetical protein C0J52_21390 [Blattella germanica]